MPRKVATPVKERPAYIDKNGMLDFNKIFRFQPKQSELLRNVSRNGIPYVQPAAPQCLSVGGIRSGKTCGWVMFGVMHYCLAFDKCDILILRRTFKELESGAIADFKTFVPKELYTYDQTKHVATFVNGSRVVFGHCQNNKERDIEQYLGQAYPFIIVDEAGQFSPEAWMMLYSRNTINASCMPDKNGNLPVPVIIGCTNPLGPFYEYYRTVFVEKEPWQKPEDARKDETNGTWWVHEAGDWRLIYDPKLYACQRSTVMDNPELLMRDPGIIARLNSMPKAKRDKMLLGLDGRTEGQYFSNFDTEYHVVNLREDPEAILFQSWQPVWAAQDWGLSHSNAAYLFTKALVRSSVGTDYKLKTVCFKETVSSGGKLHKEWAAILANMCKLPDGTPVKLKAIFFSHEKFTRQVTAHSPADEYSKELRALGLPAVTRASTDRIGGASLMYNMLGKGDLVFTDNCKEIILAIPSLMINQDNMEDVLKVNSKGDDAYDAVRYGLYGMYKDQKKPQTETIMEHSKTLDPLAAFFYRQKMLANKQHENAPFVQKEQPVWMGKV